jgi:hypothetical protein
MAASRSAAVSLEKSAQRHREAFTHGAWWTGSRTCSSVFVGGVFDDELARVKDASEKDRSRGEQEHCGIADQRLRQRNSVRASECEPSEGVDQVRHRVAQ